MLNIAGVEVTQIVLPKSLQALALEGCHDHLGHLGRDKTQYSARSILLDRNEWGCGDLHFQVWTVCTMENPTSPTSSTCFHQHNPTHELVGMDFLKVDASKGGIQNILVVMDHFTNFLKAFPCRNMTAATTAKVLYENVFLHFGFPQKLHSDQGRNFESATIKALCNLTRTNKT